MHRKEKGKTNEIPSSSNAQLRSRFTTSTDTRGTSAKSQQNETQRELEALKARRKPQLSTEKEEVPSASGSKKDIEKELAELSLREKPQHLAAGETSDRLNPRRPSPSKALEGMPKADVSTLRNNLFGLNTSTRMSAQQAEILRDRERMLQNKDNVRSKAKALDELFSNGRKNTIEQLRKNEVSQEARSKLSIRELAHFEERQEAGIRQIDFRMLADENIYNASPELQEKMTLNRFIELSFYHRSYEVCLEMDFIRHAYENVQEDGKFQINRSTGIPQKDAVRSLNYYQDFFKNLQDIEQIWHYAGKDIRESEIRVLYATKIFKDLALLADIANAEDDNAYASCFVRSDGKIPFDDQFKSFVQQDVESKIYIASGNGLSARNHPWKNHKCSRLEQPNTSIDFSNITNGQLNDRVETDVKLRFHK